MDEKQMAADLVDSQGFATLADYNGDVNAYVTALMELAEEDLGDVIDDLRMSRSQLRKWLAYYVEE